jgi:hypothetical protein
VPKPGEPKQPRPFEFAVACSEWRAITIPLGESGATVSITVIGLPDAFAERARRSAPDPA